MLPILLIAGALGVAGFALLLGLWTGRMAARALFILSTASIVVSFAIYAAQIRALGSGTPTAIALVSWISLWFAGGMFGPAWAKDRQTSFGWSAMATVVTLTAGTIGMFAAACMLVGQCL